MKLSFMKNIVIIFLVVLFFASSAFYFPRGLVLFLGKEHFLSSYLYIYGSGIPFFILGIWLLIYSKAIKLEVPGEKKWILGFVFSFIWICFIHGLLILATVKIPFK